MKLVFWRPGPDPFKQVFGELTLKEMRQLTTEELYALREAFPHKTTLVSQIESELRIREAWRAPSGKGFWISLVALAISFMALAKSFFG